MEREYYSCKPLQGQRDQAYCVTLSGRTRLRHQSDVLFVLNVDVQNEIEIALDLKNKIEQCHFKMPSYPRVFKAIAYTPQRWFCLLLSPSITNIGKSIPNPLNVPSTDIIRLLIARLNMKMFCGDLRLNGCDAQKI